MKTGEVRSAFLNYFEGLQHQVVPSDSLIPSTDPTLLFTSAGMVQFKPNFQNPSTSPYRRAASCQKCLRTSDIERVGFTLRHLTFFEMLGNFSFGDYFKEESITWGWDFLIKTLGLPADRFVVSVYRDDAEAYQVWEKLVPKDRIFLLGEDTNFWTMGPTGPCGPCSEIIWDRGPEWSCGQPSCGPACECDRYMEVWNHVFTQFDRSADGTLNPLPRKNIDTGMGLERLSLLLQGVASPFDTDAFRAIFHDLEALCGHGAPKPSKGPRVISQVEGRYYRVADHSRAVTFLVNDGILPSNEGRGYVLRRLLRQAVRAGNVLGIKEPFLFRLTGTVIESMKQAYPELVQRQGAIASIVKMEEEKFLETLETGTRKLNELVQAAQAEKRTTLAGKDLFHLYDTFGFPFELTREMVEGAGLQVDTEGFKQAQEEAVELARQGWKGSGAQDVARYRRWKGQTHLETAFRGYDTLEIDSTIAAPILLKGPDGFIESQELRSGQEGEVVVPETPFYPEGGGQVGDRGTLETVEGKAEVLDTQVPVEDFIVHLVRVEKGVIKAGAKVHAKVDPARREATMRHHTATHLLHKALREVLGSHVTQAGSLVAPDRLRFDFNHNAALTREERQRVEEIVNDQILQDLPVRACPMTKEQAHQVGAMMLFGEKYGSQVRAVMVSPYDCSRAREAWSLELCGGTHVPSTGQVGLFKIIGQSAVSAGVRRIEAVAGRPALKLVREMEYQLATVAETLKTTPAEILPRVERLLQEERQLQKELEHLKSSALRDRFDVIAQSAKSVGGILLLSQRVDGLDEKQLREFADRLKDHDRLGLVVLATAREGKVNFVVSVSQEVADRGIQAGLVARELAALIQGSGGGRADFAQGGGKNITALDPALAQVEEIVKKLAVKTKKT
jgi:alanyl-tRNA synthetase